MTNLFMFCSAFFPRITLLACYFLNAMPDNSTPFFVDVIMAIFLPRFLIAWWIYELGYHPLLVFCFVILGIMELSSSTSVNKKNGK